MPYRTSRTSAVPNRTGRRSHCGSYGSRQGSPLHSHRSSRNSGDDLWADRPLDLDPARASHTRGELDSATPWRGRGFACIVRSTGLRGCAPRPGAMERAPARGAPFPHSSLLDEYDPLHAYTAAGGCFVPQSSPLDEWLRCLSIASPPGDAPGMTLQDHPSIHYRY